MSETRLTPTNKESQLFFYYQKVQNLSHELRESARIFKLFA